MIKLLASSHARQRACQRIGWHRRTTERMPKRIFYDGIGPDDCSRRLHDFIAATTAANPAGLTRIYGEHLFLYTRDLPNESCCSPFTPSPVN